MNYKYILRPDSLWELVRSLRLCSHNGGLLRRGVREGEGPTFKGTQGREGKRGDTEREGNSLKVIVCGINTGHTTAATVNLRESYFTSICRFCNYYRVGTKTEWWGAGVVICLEGAKCRLAQMMPLPLTVSCFSKIQIGFTFLVPAYPGSPGKRVVKRVCLLVLKRRKRMKEIVKFR